jgi:5-(carboxyamino)imidazole ribonucleotide mutase
MPGGIPVGTLAIGKPGAVNAALLAVAMVRRALHEPTMQCLCMVPVRIML